MIVGRMKDTQEIERAGLGGGSIGEHDIKKLLKKFAEAADHNSAMDGIWNARGISPSVCASGRGSL